MWVFIKWICAVCAKLLQSCPTLCVPMGHSPPGSSVHRIPQIRIWSRLTFLTPGDLPTQGSNPRPVSAASAARSSSLGPPGEPKPIQANDFCMYLGSEEWSPDTVDRSPQYQCIPGVRVFGLKYYTLKESIMQAELSFPPTCYSCIKRS